MKILVAVASRHGSTEEIGKEIAAELRDSAFEVDVRMLGDVPTIDGYDGVVLGSAVYMGDWLPEARHFVERHQARLKEVPVWLFSSGPLGSDDPKPHGDPERIGDLIARVGPREHRVFVGKLDKQALGFGERLVVRAVRAPEGDFRDWELRRRTTEHPLVFAPPDSPRRSAAGADPSAAGRWPSGAHRPTNVACCSPARRKERVR
jgi:menaquinone-dependent protoporphyrinogen oxidase